MLKVFSLFNQKGGVGKTTTAVNLAACLAQWGNRTLLIDIDPQANATSGFGVDKSAIKKSVYDFMMGASDDSEVIINDCVTNVELIPASTILIGAQVELIHVSRREYVLKSQLERLRNKYDFILIDCPPSLGLLTLNALVASDAVLIPLQCEYYALEGLAQLLRTYEFVKTKLRPELEIAGVVMTMADFRTNLTQQVISEVEKHFGGKVFKTTVPRSVKVSEAPSFGKPVTLYDKNSKGAIAYREVAREFVERFGAKPVPEAPAEVRAGDFGALGEAASEEEKGGQKL